MERRAANKKSSDPSIRANKNLIANLGHEQMREAVAQSPH
jgi:hypothetical protein